MIVGFAIEAVALLCMYDWAAGKGLGTVAFVLFYVIYVIGYTIVNMTAQTIPPLMTNDPKQRPTLGVWMTALNYMVPMALTMLLNVVLLPKFGGTYSQEFLSVACKLCLTLASDRCSSCMYRSQ